MLLNLDIDPADVDPNGIAAALPTGTDWSLAGDAEWLLSGAGDALAHRLGITTAGNEPAGNAPSMTLTGTDADGNVITDTVVLPNATLVETAEYFLTVTSATTGSDTTVGLIDIGWVDEIASKTIPLAWHRNVTSSYWLDVTGTISVSVQFSIDNIEGLAKQSDGQWVEGHASLTAEVADSTAIVVVPVGFSGFRLILVSYTDGAECQLRGSQAEER